jgi:hypothetical protein
MNQPFPGFPGRQPWSCKSVIPKPVEPRQNFAYAVSVGGAETENVMPFSIPLALLGSHLVLVASVDRIPHLNYAPTCRNQTDPSAENIKQCMVNETVARDMMTQDWSQFTHRDRANCAWETSLDKSPSYINLYTCLEMEARNRKAPRSKIKGDF